MEKTTQYRSRYYNKFGKYSHKIIFATCDEARQSAIEYTRAEKGSCNVTCDEVNPDGVKIHNDGNHAFVYLYSLPNPY